MLAAFGLFFAPTFVGPMMKTVATTRMALKASAEDYPELSRVEDLIYDSCTLKEGGEALECLRLYDKLQQFHAEAKMECNLDDLRCIVLDVLDRLCSGIQGKNGLVLLNKMGNVMEAFRSKFTDWDAAFEATDADQSGELSLAELTAAIKKMNINMTEKEIGLVFMAADANGDGKIQREEFSNFMTAAVFAEEPLKAMQPDAVPLKTKTETEDILRWATGGASFA